MITSIELRNRLDIFEPGDLTALVCHDVPEVQRIIVDQLSDLGYKIHTGLFVEDILLKMRAHVYDAIVLSAHFSAESFDTQPDLSRGDMACRRHSGGGRSSCWLARSFPPATKCRPSRHSVDLVVGIADVVNLRPVFRRALLRHQELYAPLHAVEKTLSAAV